MKTALKWLVLSSIAFLGLFMALALVFSMRVNTELLSKALPMQDASMMAKSELNIFHLLLEEHLYRDRSSGIDVIWAHLDRTEWCVNVMLNGGRDDEWNYTPLTDNRLINELNMTLGELGEIRRLASRKLAARNGLSNDHDTEERFEAVVADAGVHLEAVEDELHRVIMEYSAQNRVIVAGLIFMCVVFTAASLYVSHYYISARARAEERLAEAHAFLQDIVDGVGEPIMAVNRNYEVTLLNRAARELSGVGEGWAPTKCHELSHRLDEPCQEQGIACPMKAVMESGSTTVVEHPHFGDHKAPRTMEVVASPWRDRSGNILGIIQSSRDITERKELEKQRADFYAMVTHDIKSPLTAMSGYTEIILSEKSERMDGDTREMLRMIGRSCDKLLLLVEDFLSASQMEAGKLAFKPFPADIGKILRDVCLDMEKAVRDKKLEFRTDIPDGLPSPVSIDEKLIRRALHNLLSNAVLYTPPGGAVSLAVRSVVQDGKDHLIVSVADTGPGIPKDEHGRIFDKYYRSPSSAGVKGTGLGLAIVKAVAEAHGGRVELESEPGRGSTFRLVIPVRWHAEV